MSLPEEGVPRPLADRDGEPFFDEPWQAQAIGLAFSLAERGIFSPAEWSATLGAAHTDLIDKGAGDTSATYYEAVAVALEQLLSGIAPLNAEAISDRTDAWRQAYLNTPHGAPVELSAGLKNSE